MIFSGVFALHRSRREDPITNDRSGGPTPNRIFTRRSGARSDRDPVHMVREMAALNQSLLKSSMAGAQKTNLQRQRILEAVRMEREIREAARENGVHARATADRTGQVAEDTERGHQTLEETTRNLEKMADTVTATADMMAQFVASMAEVNHMSGTISQIARQTNLLAINAAIEAAHAAREGDGFSVIAHEVRLLADRAGAAATDITEKIGEMTASARQAEVAMRAGRLAAETSIANNLEVQTTFEGIRNAVQQVKVMSAAVADRSDRQVGAGEAIQKAIEEVDGLAAQCTQAADASAEMGIGLLSLIRRLRVALTPFRMQSRSEQTAEQQASEDQLLEDRGDIVANAMQSLRRHADAAGPGIIRGHADLEGTQIPALHFGSTSAIAAAGWVDDVHRRTNCAATVFVKNQQDFIRVATNVKRPDGKRAIGTLLNPEGLAIQQLRQGKPYQGAVYVLGKPFFAIYEPVCTSSGQLVGALYVGRPVS